MRVRFQLGLLAPLAALTVASSSAFAQRDAEDWLEQCRKNNRHSDRVTYCEVRELGMRATDRLTVDAGQNGGVAVRAWDRDSIDVSARLQAQGDDEDEARDVARQVRIEISAGTIRSDGPSMRHGTSWAVSYEIRVPRRTDLKIETRNGPLKVGLEGRRWEGAGLDAETTNGPVVLSVPDGYSARLETGTVNGPMSIDFPITVQGRLSNRIAVDLGSGGAPVRVVTTNGPVVVRRQ